MRGLRWGLLLLAACGSSGDDDVRDRDLDSSSSSPPPECEVDGTGHLSVWNTGPGPLRVTVEGGTRGRVTVSLEPNVLGAETSLELDLPAGAYRVLAPPCVPVPVKVARCVVSATLVRCP